MDIRLTQFSHGAGCGCKISAAILDSILHGEVTSIADENLIVGNETKDDAAVVDLGDGTGIVSTTDFFMPIVDDPVDFGRIASVNAISDVYAMGGTPLVAIAILGWPIDKVPIEAARAVLDGARLACRDAGIALAGGHSIDAPEPIFGLAVTGRVDLKHLATNSGAKDGDTLFLTKPLGVGVLTTAEKKSLLKPEHATIARDSMVKLNRAGTAIARIKGVNAITDVTGFGLLGHLIELCEGASLNAKLTFESIPMLDASIEEYIAAGAVPGGTHRNFASYGSKVSALSDFQKAILCDPQTSGGLLISVSADGRAEFEKTAREQDLGELKPIGSMVVKGAKMIVVT